MSFILMLTVSMERKVLQDYTLSDGTFLPAGTHVACNGVATHYDENYYRDASKFDGFRFVKSDPEREGRDEVEKVVEGEGKDAKEPANIRDRVVSTSLDFLTFGHGRHAWYVRTYNFLPRSTPSHLIPLRSPGRFFAANELKTMLAYLVMNYDIRLESHDGKAKPLALHFASATIPDPKARVLFRRRVVAS